MRWRTHVAAFLIVIGVVAAMPGRAEAQGFLDWIHRMSGPGFVGAVGVKVSACLNKAVVGQDDEGNDIVKRCLMVGAPIVPQVGAGAERMEDQLQFGPRITFGDKLDPVEQPRAERLSPGSQASGPGRPDWEWQVGFSASRGWNGTNDDKDIANVNMLMFEPSVSVMRPLGKNKNKGGPVLSGGLGFHRFWGGTVPEPFWNQAATLVVGYRFEFGWDKDPETNPDALPRWSFVAGYKARYFFDRMETGLFGGTPEPGEETRGGEWASGATFGFGYRFKLFSW